MYELKSSDIIKRAQQLADLENSDFISWNENINLLNESYKILYQKLINKGDQAFVKSFTCSGNTCLPNDFYQLRSVNEFQTNRPIQRKSINQNNYDRWYEIKNGAIYLNNPTDTLIQYFPLPDTITYPNKDVEFDFNNSIVDTYESLVLYVNESKFYVYDLETNEIIFEDTGVGKKIHGEFVFYRDDNGYDGYVNFYTNEKERCESMIKSENGSVYFTELTIDGSIVFRPFDNEVLTTIPSFLKEKNCVCSEDLTDFYYVSSTNKLARYFNETSIISDVSVNSNYIKMIYADESLYFGDNTKFGAIAIDEDNQKDYLKIYNGYCYGINKIDGNTGYGFTTKSKGNFVIKSYLEDTLINYPSTIYYTMLSYQLALAYKAKQNADSTQLSIQAQSAELQFFDSLSQDDFSFVRIQNVY